MKSSKFILIGLIVIDSTSRWKDWGERPEIVDSLEYREIDDIVGLDKKDPATVGLTGIYIYMFR
jgi:hypothetical protein